jgi:hypothetical protein
VVSTKQGFLLRISRSKRAQLIPQLRQPLELLQELLLEQQLEQLRGLLRAQQQELLRVQQQELLRVQQQELLLEQQQELPRPVAEVLVRTV